MTLSRHLAALTLLLSGAAHAQWLGADYAQYGAPMSSFMSNTFLNQQGMIRATVGRQAVAQPAPQAAAVRATAPLQLERNAHELALFAPPAQRPQLEKVFMQTMPVYRKIESQLGWAAGDLSGALAAFIAGNHMAMTGTEVPDDQVKAFAQQLRGSAATQRMLAGLDANARQTLYEQSAMLGTFMALAHRATVQQPQPTSAMAQMRGSARNNLRRALGSDPDAWRWGPGGLTAF
jgi:hypothetical protein